MNMTFSGGGAPDWAILIGILGVGTSFLWFTLPGAQCHGHFLFGCFGTVAGTNPNGISSLLPSS